jgi:hypothetical protein
VRAQRCAHSELNASYVPTANIVVSAPPACGLKGAALGRRPVALKGAALGRHHGSMPSEAHRTNPMRLRPARARHCHC